MNRISEILHSARTIAVVGLSGKRFRPSYGVAEYMKRAGYRIIPVNPMEKEVLGERSLSRPRLHPGAGRHRGHLPPLGAFVPEIVEAAIRNGRQGDLDAGGRHPRSRRRARPRPPGSRS